MLAKRTKREHNANEMKLSDLIDEVLNGKR